MNQPKVVCRGKHYPVKELHFSEYNGELVMVVTTTEYDREKEFNHIVYEVEQPGKVEEDGSIILVYVRNRNSKALLILSKC